MGDEGSVGDPDIAKLSIVQGERERRIAEWYEKLKDFNAYKFHDSGYRMGQLFGFHKPSKLMKLSV